HLAPDPEPLGLERSLAGLDELVRGSAEGRAQDAHLLDLAVLFGARRRDRLVSGEAAGPIDEFGDRAGEPSRDAATRQEREPGAGQPQRERDEREERDEPLAEEGPAPGQEERVGELLSVLRER